MSDPRSCAIGPVAPNGTGDALARGRSVAAPRERGVRALVGPVRRFDHTLDLFSDDDEDEEEDDEVEGDREPASVPTLPIVAAEQATGRTYEPDATGPEGATIDHPGPAGVRRRRRPR